MSRILTQAAVALAFGSSTHHTGSLDALTNTIKPRSLLHSMALVVNTVPTQTTEAMEATLVLQALQAAKVEASTPPTFHSVVTENTPPSS